VLFLILMPGHAACALLDASSNTTAAIVASNVAVIRVCVDLFMMNSCGNVYMVGDRYL
jgi:hypothetical protein